MILNAELDVSVMHIYDPRFSAHRHALDIREHYERKLERANNLYMELNAIMLQLEIKEKELLKYENCPFHSNQ